MVLNNPPRVWWHNLERMVRKFPNITPSPYSHYCSEQGPDACSHPHGQGSPERYA